MRERSEGRAAKRETEGFSRLLSSFYWRNQRICYILEYIRILKDFKPSRSVGGNPEIYNKIDKFWGFYK